MTRPLVKLSLPVEQAETFRDALSDLLCWHAGFKAAREGRDMDGYVLGVEGARDLNIKLKAAIEDALDPVEGNAPMQGEAPDAS